MILRKSSFTTIIAILISCLFTNYLFAQDDFFKKAENSNASYESYVNYYYTNRSKDPNLLENTYEEYYQFIKNAPEVKELEQNLQSLIKERSGAVTEVDIALYYTSSNVKITPQVYRDALAASIEEVKSIPATEFKNNHKTYRFVAGSKFDPSGEILTVPMPSPKGFWFGFLSKQGTEHLKFKSYLKKRQKKELTKALEHSTSLSEEEKKKIINYLTTICGKEEVYSRDNGSNSDLQNLIRDLSPSSSPSDVEVDKYEKGNSINISVENKDLHSWFRRKHNSREFLYYIPLKGTSSKMLHLKLVLNNKCLLTDGLIENYDLNNKKNTDKIEIDGDGEVIRNFVYNPEIKNPCEFVGFSEEFNRILQTGYQSQKVVIALLDVGVDYNDPKVALNLARIPNHLVQIEKRAQKSNERAKEAIEREKSFFEVMLKKISLLNDNDATLTRTMEINQLILERAKQKRLQSKFFVGKDFEEMDDTPFDFYKGTWYDPQFRQHGTSMAKILSKSSEDVQILNIKKPAFGLDVNERLAESIEYGIQFGASIVNMSFGVGESEGMIIEKAIQKHKDIFFVSAAGNSNSDFPTLHDRNLNFNPHYPAAIKSENHLVVANLTKDKKLSRSSYYSQDFVEIGIYSPSATSGSAAEVSRIAGRIKKICPKLKGSEIKEVLLKTADLIDELKPFIKNGAVANENRAIEYAQKYCQ